MEQEITMLGNMPLKKGKPYFFWEAYDGDEKTKVALPVELRQRIYDIIRDESADEFDLSRKQNIDEDEINGSVDFIMGEIAELIEKRNYNITKTKVLTGKD